MRINNVAVLVTVDEGTNPHELILTPEQRTDLQTFLFYLVNGEMKLHEKKLEGVELATKEVTQCK